MAITIVVRIEVVARMTTPLDRWRGDGIPTPRCQTWTAAGA